MVQNSLKILECPGTLNTTAPELENALKINNLGDLDAFITGWVPEARLWAFITTFHKKRTISRLILSCQYKNEDGGHRIEGIGDSFIPNIVNLQALSPIVRVNDADAINIARQINKLGLSVGISSGANVFGAILKALELGNNKNVATILM